MRKRTHPKRRRRAGKGALFLISLVFLSSALVRLGDGAGSAIAKEISALQEPALEPIAQQECSSDDGIAELFASLKAREDRVKSREDAVVTRLQTLRVAEAEIEKGLQRLVQAEESLSAKIALSQTAAEDDLSKLTSVYEQMKPKDAATLFEAMDAEFSAGFLARMRPDSAAAILAGLSPEKAYTISVVLAGRNTSAPTE